MLDGPIVNRSRGQGRAAVTLVQRHRRSRASPLAVRMVAGIISRRPAQAGVQTGGPNGSPTATASARGLAAPASPGFDTRSTGRRCARQCPCPRQWTSRCYGCVWPHLQHGASTGEQEQSPSEETTDEADGVRRPSERVRVSIRSGVLVNELARPAPFLNLPVRTPSNAPAAPGEPVTFPCAAS